VKLFVGGVVWQTCVPGAGFSREEQKRRKSGNERGQKHERAYSSSKRHPRCMIHWLKAVGKEVLTGKASI